MWRDNSLDSEYSNELLTIDFEEYKTETDAAWLLTIEGEDIWLPKSQCHINKNSESIEVPRRLCKKYGWD